MVNRLLSILLLIFGTVLLYGQNNSTNLDGVVSYRSSKNIYVKFASTVKIKVDDTLFIEQVVNKYQQ